MSTFKIAWRNIDTGQRGSGRKAFPEDEAMVICAELNEQYPHIEHVPVAAGDAPKFQSEPVPLPTPVLPLTDTDLMPFGMHKGKPMAQVPSSYLDYMSGQKWLEPEWPRVAEYIERNRPAIDQDLTRENWE